MILGARVHLRVPCTRPCKHRTAVYLSTNLTVLHALAMRHQPERDGFTTMDGNNSRQEKNGHQFSIINRIGQACDMPWKSASRCHSLAADFFYLFISTWSAATGDARQKKSAVYCSPTGSSSFVQRSLRTEARVSYIVYIRPCLSLLTTKEKGSKVVSIDRRLYWIRFFAIDCQSACKEVSSGSDV